MLYIITNTSDFVNTLSSLRTGILAFMIIQQWLQEHTKTLQNAGVETARLDCLVLLEDVTGHDRAWLLAHMEHKLTSTQTETLGYYIERRAAHEPLAYIRGTAEFYGRPFAVTSDVIVPRPESEAMIDILLTYAKDQTLSTEDTTVIDVGTGSGCLAITAALELPEARIIATDVDQACLIQAQRNAQRLGANVTFRRADLLAGITSVTGRLIVLANLPYVPIGYPINQAAHHEPAKALFGGNDGLDLYRYLFEQAANRTLSAQAIITESLPEQHSPLVAIATQHGFHVGQSADLAQLFVI